MRNQVPPIGSVFERVTKRGGRVISTRRYELIESAPEDPDMAGEHGLMCIGDESINRKPGDNGIFGEFMTVETAWFTERTDFKLVE